MSSFRPLAAMAATAGLMLMSPVFAQTASPTIPTAPSSASSPSQRSAMGAQTPEAPTTNGANPADASSPHQAKVTSGSKAMKACMEREQAAHTELSQAEVKKTCKDQLKGGTPKG